MTQWDLVGDDIASFHTQIISLKRK